MPPDGTKVWLDCRRSSPYDVFEEGVNVMASTRTVVDKKGRVHTITIADASEMPESEKQLTAFFRRQVEEAIMVSKFRGNPVARYDEELNVPYMEYADGTRKY